MPIVTSDREVPGNLRSFRTEHPATAVAQFGGLGAPWQYTTSYRTGRAYRDWIPEEETYTTYSENFKKYKEELKASTSQLDSGHEFTTEFNFSSCNREATVIKGNPGDIFFGDPTFRYYGPLVSSSQDFTGGYFPTVPPYSTASIDGTHAISRTVPTDSAGGLNVAVTELFREGLPSFLGFLKNMDSKVASLAQMAGDQYLNVEFGWKPLVADIKQACHALTHANKVLTQYQRDSGRMVRRRFYWPDEHDTVENYVENDIGRVYGLNLGLPAAFNRAFSSVGGHMSDITTTYRKRWFKGAYTYYVNNGSSNLDRMIRFEQLSNHLLGTRMTPDILWQLAPWSWLSDWTNSVGEVIHNASALGQDGLVIRYGYQMCTTTVVRTRVLSGVSTYADGPVGDLVSQYGTCRKERHKATPYGFGIDVSGFSPRRWAILAALGLTRSPNALRQQGD